MAFGSGRLPARADRRSLLPKAGQTLGTDSALSQTPDLRPRILVVDDIEANRDLLVLRLEREGYGGIATAGDGEEALERLAAESFDLVLLDVMMPRRDGYGVLQQLKTDGRLADLPVIVISANNEMDSVVRCIELGAVDYLQKPFNPTLLRARVMASLEKKRLRDEVRAHLARLSVELDAARELQASMLPGAFPAPTAERPLEIFATMVPAREIGGDLYDFFFIPGGRLCFLVGDVSGKGIPAALFMARAKNLIQLVTELLAEARGEPPLPAEIIERVNRELAEDNATMMFVTLFFGMLDPASGELLYCNAGHDAPFLVGGGSVGDVDGPRAMALGIDVDQRYATGRAQLRPGEVLYLFTDGITEAMNRQDQLFARTRLGAALAAAPDDSPRTLVESVAAAVQGFAEGAPQADDVTALAIRLTALKA